VVATSPLTTRAESSVTYSFDITFLNTCYFVPTVPVVGSLGPVNLYELQEIVFTPATTAYPCGTGIVYELWEVGTPDVKITSVYTFDVSDPANPVLTGTPT